LTHALATSESPESQVDEVKYSCAQSKQYVGSGIEGEIGDKRILVGSPAFLRERCGELPADIETAIHSFTEEALTPIVIALNGTAVAVAGLGDPIRPDAFETLRQIRAYGWKVGVLSGDHPDVVQKVCNKLGLDPQNCHGGLSPEQKLNFITNNPTSTSVMVGDGVNDAAALSAATVGIGVHGGAEASLAIADIYLSRSGLSPLYELISGAKRTMQIIRRTFMLSVVYNSIGASLAIAGIITPLLAAVLMPISSLTVITIAYRSRTFSEINQNDHAK
jgi:Cu2+-exporting ATPase